MMLPIDNFFRAAALWPDRIAVEIADADGCQQISYAALVDMTRAMAAMPHFNYALETRFG